MSLRRLAHDCEAEPRSGQLAGAVGAVEALEHMRQVGLLEARAVITNCEHPVVQLDLDRLARWAPLARVVKQIRHCAIHAVGFSLDDRRLQVCLKTQFRAPLCALHGAPHDLIQTHILRYALALRAARELCDRHGVVLLIDEVKTGFRVARGGVQELYGIKADLCTFAKALPKARIRGRWRR